MQNKREQLLNISQQLVSMGLNRGAAGNASVRANNAEGEAGFLITPSGLAANKMTPSDMVWMDFAGNKVGGVRHQVNGDSIWIFCRISHKSMR